MRGAITVDEGLNQSIWEKYLISRSQRPVSQQGGASAALTRPLSAFSPISYPQLLERDIYMFAPGRIQRIVEECCQGLKVAGYLAEERPDDFDHPTDGPIFGLSDYQPSPKELIIICSFSRGDQEANLERLGLKHLEHYLRLDDLLRTLNETETAWAARWTPGRKNIVLGSGRLARLLMINNPGLEIDYFIASNSETTLAGRPVRSLEALDRERPGKFNLIVTAASEERKAAVNLELSRRGLVEGDDFHFYDWEVSPFNRPLARRSEKKLIVMGSGRICLAMLEDLPDLEIDYFIDNNPEKHSTLIHGRPVKPVAALQNEPPGSFEVLVTISDQSGISEQLTGYGLELERDFFFYGHDAHPLDFYHPAYFPAELMADILARAALAETNTPETAPKRFWGRVFSNTLILADYDGAPEVAESWEFADDSPAPADRLFYRELSAGRLTDKTRPIIGPYSQNPPLKAFRLKNAVIHQGMVCSLTGTLFSENFLYGARRRWDNLMTQFVTHEVLKRAGFADEGRYVLADVPPPEDTVDETCLLFYTNDSFGHFLTENPAKLWFLLKTGLRPKLLVHPGYRQTGIPGYVDEIIKPFGLTEKDLIIAPETCLCRDLITVSKPHVLLHLLTGEALNVYRRIAAYHSQRVSAAYPEKIYVSRRKYAAATGSRPFNEEDCEAIFKEYGYTVIYPELLPMDEQIRFFAHAGQIAGAMGSAIHNILFSLKKRRLIVMTPVGFDVALDAAVFIENASEAEAPIVVYGRYCDRDLGRQDSLGNRWRVEPEHLRECLAGLEAETSAARQ